MRRLWPIIVLLVAGVVLAACGGGAAAPTTTPVPAPTVAPTEPPAAMAGDAAAGQKDYETYCIACHGPGAVGVQGLGKSWVKSTFIKSQTDEQLLAFVKKGRPTSDPQNTTGVDMPPKGGNPALSDTQIMDIIAYMRTINNP